MAKHVGALFLIFMAAAAAWMILAGVLDARTQQTQSQAEGTLGVLWGPAQSQSAPSIRPATSAALAIAGSRLNIDLDLVQRQKGLLWFDTYRVAFSGAYRVIGPRKAGAVDFFLPFPAQGAVYDHVHADVRGMLP